MEIFAVKRKGAKKYQPADSEVLRADTLSTMDPCVRTMNKIFKNARNV